MEYPRKLKEIIQQIVEEATGDYKNTEAKYGFYRNALFNIKSGTVPPFSQIEALTEKLPEKFRQELKQALLKENAEKGFINEENVKYFLEGKRTLKQIFSDLKEKSENNRFTLNEFLIEIHNDWGSKNKVAVDFLLGFKKKGYVRSIFSENREMSDTHLIHFHKDFSYLTRVPKKYLLSHENFLEFMSYTAGDRSLGQISEVNIPNKSPVKIEKDGYAALKEKYQLLIRNEFDIDKRSILGNQFYVDLKNYYGLSPKMVQILTSGYIPPEKETKDDRNYLNDLTRYGKGTRWFGRYDHNTHQDETRGAKIAEGIFRHDPEEAADAASMFMGKGRYTPKNTASSEDKISVIDSQVQTNNLELYKTAIKDLRSFFIGTNNFVEKTARSKKLRFSKIISTLQNSRGFNDESLSRIISNDTSAAKNALMIFKSYGIINNDIDFDKLVISLFEPSERSEMSIALARHSNEKALKLKYTNKSNYQFLE